MSKHFVLVHGAWHGSWAWDGVIAELEAAGHTAEAVVLPGTGPEDPRGDVTFDDYVDAIVDNLQAQPVPVILVGHSSAGFLLQAAAPRAADKIEKVVFHNAFILPDGTSQFDLVPPEASAGLTAAAGATPDNAVPVIPDVVCNMLMPEEPKEMQDALISKLVPQPLTLFTTRIDAKPFAALDVPRAVVFCRDDASLPPGAFLGMAQSLGEFDLVETPGGHETLFTKPEVVAKALLQVAGD